MASHVDNLSDFESDDEIDTLTDHFNKAAKHVERLASELDRAKLLKLYALYKQSIEGRCTKPKPSWYEVQAKTKWEAWFELGDMPKDVAKENYIQIVKELDPNWTIADDVKENTSKTEGWNIVSSMLNTDEVKIETDKNIFDYVKEGNMERIRDILKNKNELKNSLDEEGMGLVHWAADRGNIEILKLLLNCNIDVNLKDADGQTALHYAASCGHLDCVELLLKSGIDLNAKDMDHSLAIDVATGDEIVNVLKNFSMSL